MNNRRKRLLLDYVQAVQEDLCRGTILFSDLSQQEKAIILNHQIATAERILKKLDKTSAIA